MKAVEVEIILGGMQELGVGRNKKRLICAVGQLFFVRTENRPLIGFTVLLPYLLLNRPLIVFFL